MKLILFICMFVSADTACYPSFPPCPRHTVSGLSVLCARHSFHASFVASKALLINKTLFFFLPLPFWHVSVRQLIISARAGLGEASCSSASCCRGDSEGKYVELITSSTVTHLEIMATSINKSVNLIVLGLCDDGFLN